MPLYHLRTRGRPLGIHQAPAVLERGSVILQAGSWWGVQFVSPEPEGSFVAAWLDVEPAQAPAAAVVAGQLSALDDPGVNEPSAIAPDPPDNEYLDVPREPDIAFRHGAVDYIKQRGGQLYVWTTPFSRGYVSIEAAATSPGLLLAFDRYPLDEGVQLWITEEALHCGRLVISKRVLHDGLSVETSFSRSMGTQYGSDRG